MMMKAVKESKPDVGSSNKTTYGFVTNSKPIEVLFFYPPEIPLMDTPPIFKTQFY